MSQRLFAFTVLALAAAACDVDDETTLGTGTELLPASGGDPRAYLVVATDYQSTSVGVVDAAGSVQSPTLIASSSAAPGLSTALSGDVVPPSSRQPGAEAVLIDRAQNVLSWVDVASASVRAQLNVGTGFAANPQDYLALSADEALVPRFAQNPEPGREPFDTGSDLLVIDPRTPAIARRIDLSSALDGEEPGFLPRPSRVVLAGGLVRALLLVGSEDFRFGSSRVASIDPQSDRIVSVLVLEGLTNCSNVALSPDGSRLALGCSGSFAQDPALGFPDAGIVLLAVGDELVETRRFPASALGGEQIGSVSFASERVLAFTATGRYTSDQSALAAPDALRVLDLETGSASEPLVSTEVSAFSLGDVRCAPTLGVCLLADAEAEGGLLRRLALEGGTLVEAGRTELGDSSGLPPRFLGEL